MSSRFRLRRIDRAPDGRTHTYETRDEANDARAAIPKVERDEWEVVVWGVSDVSGPSTPSRERTKRHRTFTLADEVFETIQKLSKETSQTNTGVVESAVMFYAKSIRKERE